MLDVGPLNLRHRPLNRTVNVAWTSHTETQRHIVEECPATVVVMEDRDLHGPGTAKDLSCMPFPHRQ